MRETAKERGIGRCGKRWDIRVNLNNGDDRAAAHGIGSGEHFLKKVTTFFVYNFPERCSEKDLWKAFCKVGHLVDVFIANKPSALGKRFGFARFMGVKDIAALGRMLNDVWFGNCRL